MRTAKGKGQKATKGKGLGVGAGAGACLRHNITITPPPRRPALPREVKGSIPVFFCQMEAGEKIVVYYFEIVLYIIDGGPMGALYYRWGPDGGKK